MNISLDEAIKTLARYAVENPNTSLDEKAGLLKLAEQMIRFINENTSSEKETEIVDEK